jgi:lipoprotein-anchoring transpeptidase ErfK/SrfK
LTAGRKTEKDRVAYKVVGAKSATCRLSQIVPQTNAESQTPSLVARSAETELPALGTKKNDFGIVITIDKTEQRMTVSLDGVERYVWPVSTGQPGYSTPSGTYTASSMNEMWYSKQWDNAPMPHAVFFTREGHAIHGTSEVKRLGNPASHGCVRISPQNAATLYALVEKNGLENTQVVLTGITPGGESNLEAWGGWGFGP